MHAKSTWNWQFASARETAQGTVDAVDPRDALSRALTSPTPSGRMLGDVHRIPVSVIAAAPANYDDCYKLEGDVFSLRVQRMAG